MNALQVNEAIGGGEAARLHHLDERHHVVELVHSSHLSGFAREAKDLVTIFPALCRDFYYFSSPQR